MGEFANLVGDRGEEIVKYLFEELLGYSQYQEKIDIKCVDGENHHINPEKTKKSHGIDGFLYYKSPLEDSCLDIGIISSKYTTKKYPNSQLRPTFREYFKDLAWTLECFRNSEKKSDIESSVSGVETTKIYGVLFWLSNHQESFLEDTLPEISKSEFGGDSLIFDQIVYIDNARLSFLVSVLYPLRQKYGDKGYSFVYPLTGHNLLLEENKGFGYKFPIQFFSYDILPLRIEETIGNEKNITFYLACRKGFDAEDFNKIAGLAKTFNHLQATKRTIISFPDYNEVNHKNLVKQKLSSFLDEDFTDQIIVTGYNLDFRNFK